MPLEGDLNVLGLSDSIVTGSPLLLVNRPKASMKASELSLFVNSRWTALVEAHVNKHTYALASSSFAPFSEVYRGPAKSILVCVKGGSSETRSSGRSGCCRSEKFFPSTFLHLTHLLTIFLTVCRPRIIQNRSLITVKVAFTPLSNIRLCLSLMINSTPWCFEGNKIGILASWFSTLFWTLPLHRIRPLSSR